MSGNDDFLLEDRPANNNKHVILSYLTPNVFKMTGEEEALYERFRDEVLAVVRDEFGKMQNNTHDYDAFRRAIVGIMRPEILALTDSKYFKYKDFYGIKVRGAFEDAKDCMDYGDRLQRIDKHHNAFCGDMYAWLPLDDNPDKAQNVQFGEKELNDLMKGYLEKQKEADDVFQKRKIEMKMEALKNGAVSTTEAPPVDAEPVHIDPEEIDKSLEDLRRQLEAAKRNVKK